MPGMLSRTAVSSIEANWIQSSLSETDRFWKWNYLGFVTTQEQIAIEMPEFS